MTKLDLAIAALEALPEHLRDEIADMALELAAAVDPTAGPAMTEEQIAESLRRAADFKPADLDRLAALMARFA